MWWNTAGGVFMSRARRNVSTRSRILASQKRMNLSGASQKLNKTMRIYFRDIGIVFKKNYFAIFVEIIYFSLNYSTLARKGIPILIKFLILYCKLANIN